MKRYNRPMTPSDRFAWPPRLRTVIAITVVAVAVLGAACDSVGELPRPSTTEAPPPETSSTTPETTIPPETTPPETSPPESTSPEDPEAESTTPWWLLILSGVALIALIVAFVSRGSKKDPPPPPPGRLTWRDHAKAGYAGARWAFDALSEDVAIWRGNAQFDGTTDIGSTAGTSLAETWAQLGPRIDTARDSLYALEADAPDPRTSEMARSVITTMAALRGAVDARAEARFAYRSAEQSATESPTALIEARDREIRASTNFNIARSDFAQSLNRFATIA